MYVVSFKKETFQTDGEYYSSAFCWSMIKRAKNPSKLSRIITDQIAVFTVASNEDGTDKNGIEFCNKVANQIAQQIDKLDRHYEKKWCYALLDSVFVNKAIDNIGYHVVSNNFDLNVLKTIN